MKKVGIGMVFLLVLYSPLMAQSNDIKKDKEIQTLAVPENGQLKLGVLLGYPLEAIFSYRTSNWFETNIGLGYNFRFNAAMLSGNALFTLVNIPAGKTVMPLSLGPQVNFLFGLNFYIEIVAILRLEYSFLQIPLNLFLEGGFGFRFLDQSDWTTWNGGVGVRYIF